MNTFKIILLAMLAGFASCSSDESQTITNELDGLALAAQIENPTHIIELYSPSGTFQQGHNFIALRIKDKTTERYTEDASVSWLPIMQMATMQHSCPYSAVTKTIGKETLYDGYIVFQMAENSTEYWSLTIDYTIDGINYSASDNITVPASAKRRVSSFTGTDGASYIVAMIEPADPKVAINDMTAGIFKRESMMHFAAVAGYTLQIDPRMPSMGNHGSPNNQHLTQGGDGHYHGKLSLTMTGYWKINLQLLDANDLVLKGEPVSDTNPESSLYFEVEF